MMSMNKNTKKAEKLSVPSTWSRQTMLLVSAVVTSLVFLLDSALPAEAVSSSIVADLGSEFVFYAAGLVAAFVYLKLNPAFGKPKGKKVKDVDNFEKPVRASAAPVQASVSAEIKKALLEGRKEEALQLLVEAEKAGTADVACYSAVIEAHVQQGNVRKASGLLRRMKEAGLAPEPSLYNTLISACGSRGLLSEAREVFSDMKAHGLKPSVVTFTALIDASAKAWDLQSAEHWMTAMSEMNIEANVVSYSTMINCCAKVGDLSRAEFWFDRMREKGVEPNAFSMSALINACAKNGDAEAACAWLKRAQELKMAFDVVVYSCVINACAKAGDAERAMEVFEQMRADGIAANIVIYSALAKPYAYKGEFREVERIAEIMEKEGIVMNDFFLYSLLLAYSRSRVRQAERAEAAFVKAMQNGVQMNERIQKVLASAVGYGRAQHLCRQY